MTGIRVILLSFAALSSGVCGCGSAAPQAPLLPGRDNEQLAVLVEAVWHANREVIESALDTKGEIDQERFTRAIEFFEGVTGIPSDTLTTFGRLPLPQLRNTLDQWNLWYETNRNFLSIDLLACRLEVAENKNKGH